MKALSIPGLENSLSGGPVGPPSLSSGTSSPAGSWAGRPARPRPSLNVGGGGGVFDLSSSSPAGRSRPAPKSLIFTSSSLNSNEASVLEQEHKLNEIMRKSGQLKIHGQNYSTHIDDLELLGDLGNGTCGHVVKMRHRQSGEVIAVKQMRRTGNSDETKRIIMDLDVVLKSHDCEEIVLCLGCFITDSDVWICMELMATCFDKLLKQLKQPIPEPICGKVAVATVKALHYLKERHGVIHRDVKPSNILLDTYGRVKLCDFGISGRLVDSKAKTRSAGCAAYMAPERIEPPNPYNPNYDIRADVWSLGITLVEMATGHFPYRDCKTDFELLTKVIQDDPPMLPVNKFSREFELFVRDCLMKDYKDRPKYKKLLMHPFIKKYEKEEVNVGAWYKGVMQTSNNGSLTTPNNNQSAATFDPLANAQPSERATFKPQPSPRVVRSWRPSNATPSSPPPAAPSAPLTAQQYPSAISEQRAAAEGQRRPSFELLEARRYNDLSSQYVTSKPPPALPSPSSSTSTTVTSSADPAKDRYRHYMSSTTSVTDSPMLVRSSAARRSDYNYYERWQPQNYSGRPSSSSSNASPYSGSYGSPLHYRSQHYFSRNDPELDSSRPTSAGQQATSNQPPPLTVPRYGYRESPRSVRKFDFTYPQTSIVGSYHDSNSSSSAAQPSTSNAQGLGLTPRGYSRRLSTEQHHVLPHHYSSHYQQLQAQNRGRSPTRERGSAMVGGNPSSASGSAEDQRSPSQERSNGRTYFHPSSWRSTLSSLTPSFRRLRTASSDRSNAFDTARRFQPSYRSWNEKDNFYPSSMSKR